MLKDLYFRKLNTTQFILGSVPVGVESLLPFEGLATVQAEAGVDFLGLLDLRRNVAGG